MQRRAGQQAAGSMSAWAQSKLMIAYMCMARVCDSCTWSDSCKDSERDRTLCLLGKINCLLKPFALFCTRGI